MAPVPSFVGYSPWATSVLPTGSIVTVTSSCLPSGTAIGDDVFVFIRFSQFIGGGSGPSPTTPSGWQKIYTVFNSNSDFTLVYRTRYTPSSFPMSVALTGAGPTPPGTVISTFGMAMTPNYAITSSTSGGWPPNSTGVPGVGGLYGWSPGTLSVPTDGTVLAIGIQSPNNNGQLTTFSAANGFTEVADVGGYVNTSGPNFYTGNIKIAQYQTLVPATVTPPNWNKVAPGFGGSDGGAVAFAYTSPQPLPVLTHTGAMTT